MAMLPVVSSRLSLPMTSRWPSDDEGIKARQMASNPDSRLGHRKVDWPISKGKDGADWL
jgi:hypothetical protein